MNIAKYIDHTILKPTATEKDIIQLCQEAKEYGFAAVCVPPYFVATAKTHLKDTEVKVATVIGFPFGYSSTDAKIQEIRQAIEDGVDELDMVQNLLALKNGDWEYLKKEIEACIGPVKGSQKIIKVIVESGMLTDEELLQCCKLYSESGIDFMKTSTGYAEVGATVHAVDMMRRNLPLSIAIKASGGIKSFAFAQQLVEAGASRIGCSASIQIVQKVKTDYFRGIMKSFQHIILFILSFFATGQCVAQGLAPISGDSTGIMVYADPRVLILTKKHTAVTTGAIYISKGYRVQIYSGGDRLKATQVKVDFMRRFPGVRTYMSYIQPQFRVKVGDFKSRAEAAVMYRQVNNLYSPCMIVPDVVEINTFKNDQQNTGENK